MKASQDERAETIGDGPADIMDAALEEIHKEYMDNWGRPPTLNELTAVFNFCTGPMRDGQE